MNEQKQTEPLYVVTESLINRILGYLSNRPYKEVMDLMEGIRTTVRPLPAETPGTTENSNEPSKAAS